MIPLPPPAAMPRSASLASPKPLTRQPRMMVALLSYCYATDMRLSRKVMERCQIDVACRVILGGNVPDFRTISDFRKLHLARLEALFVEILIDGRGVTVRASRRSLEFPRNADRAVSVGLAARVTFRTVGVVYLPGFVSARSEVSDPPHPFLQQAPGCCNSARRSCTPSPQESHP
jgi:hypothetical protein